MNEDVAQGTEHEALFVDSIRRFREAQGLSQGDLANRLSKAGWKFRQTTVSRIEKRERTVRLAEAHAIAECLNVSLADMLAEDQNTDDAQRLRQLDDEIRDLSEEFSSLIAQCVQLQTKLQQVTGERDAVARSLGNKTPKAPEQDLESSGVIDLMDVLAKSLTRPSSVKTEKRNDG